MKGEGADGTDPAILDLLDALEGASETLQQFRASLVYERVHALTDGAELQYGTVVYERLPARPVPPKTDPERAAGEPRPEATTATRLGVFFDEYVDSTGRSERIQQRFVFAEGWLVEVDPGRRQFIKRQIVPPGQKFDPLKLGEGPFPLPVGQRRVDVLSRFEAVPAPPPTDRLLDRITEQAIREGLVRALRLVPRPGTSEAEEFASVDLYYERESLLPIGVVAIAPSGDRKIVRLSGIRRNEKLPEELLRLLSVDTPTDTAGWTIDVRPWKS